MEEIMGHADKALHHTVPPTQAILEAWLPFKKLIGVTAVRTEDDYAQACATMNALLDEVGDNEQHPLAEVLDYLADQVKSYEDDNFHIPEAAPHEVLRFLMEQHSLKQDDLAGCASQSRISDILNGKRSISKEIAKRLALHFHVRADLFL
jgi:HTH-type transcriptional regulator/antitoxin HigA